jgi:diaminopropionate ammonia-lyase family
MFFANPGARRQNYDPALKSIMSIERGAQSRSWLSTWSQLLKGSTPVRHLPRLASQLSLGQISIKDESVRSPLGSFKALGAPIALLRLILRRWPDENFQAADLLEGRHSDALKHFVVISATDGNHGRALAAAAQSIGCRCVIVLHANVSAEREQPIRELGAQIIRVRGNYDESVLEAARLASANGWWVVSDTSYEGYEQIPRDVMQGYGIIVDEALEQMAAHECPIHRGRTGAGRLPAAERAQRPAEQCHWDHGLRDGRVGLRQAVSTGVALSAAHGGLLHDGH